RRFGGSRSTPPGGCGSAAASNASEMAASRVSLIIGSADRSREGQKITVPFHVRRLRNYALCPQGVRASGKPEIHGAARRPWGAVAVCQGGLGCRSHPVSDVALRRSFQVT